MSSISELLYKIFSVIQWCRAKYGALQSRIWNYLLTWFYNRLPTEEGELDEQLDGELKKHLLFVGVRFRGFNESVGQLIGASFGITLLLFIPAIVFGAFTVTFPDVVPTIVLLLILFIFAVIFIAALTGIVVTNLIILLYLGAVLKFGLQQIRANLSRVTKPEREQYTCLQEGSEVQVYVGNFSSYIRGIIYGLLLLLISLSAVASPWILKASRWLAAQVPAGEIPRTWVLQMLAGIVASINAIVHIDLAYFSSSEGVQSLTILFSGLLVFSLFLNGKSILQMSQKSRFGWSELEEFDAWDEVKRCGLITEICLHHLIHGDLQPEFGEIRGEILRAAFVLVVTFGLSAFYLYLYLGAV